MSKTMTLDEIEEQFVADYKDWDAGKWDYNGLDPKQKFHQSLLQWVADEVVGKKVSHKAVAERLKGVKDSASVHDAVHAVNDRIDVQRQILKDHGWKGGDE
ncbi:hypothetical protein [Mycolicibacterium sp. PDY-3]|uniref:hypothetical protein n=1 Tax=Mycolicibacterium sp. PDY-3 TaxID=3376069 RepID=UPI0037967759